MKRFHSKIDRWLFLVLLLSLVVDVAAIGFVILVIDEPLVLTFVVIALLGTAALVGSILIWTYYTVDKEYLRIVSGPVRLKVRLDDIRSIKATRNPLSSPALSLDRLMIKYGKNRKVMVSPADRRGFLRAIGRQLEE